VYFLLSVNQPGNPSITSSLEDILVFLNCSLCTVVYWKCVFSPLRKPLRTAQSHKHEVVHRKKADEEASTQNLCLQWYHTLEVKDVSLWICWIDQHRHQASFRVLRSAVHDPRPEHVCFPAPRVGPCGCDVIIIT
jgi:hypothetical protein